MFFTGCGADQNPLPRRKLEQAAVITGPTPLHGADVRVPDLRGHEADCLQVTCQEIVDWLHRVQRTRGRRGWPEQAWQAEVVRRAPSGPPRRDRAERWTRARRLSRASAAFRRVLRWHPSDSNRQHPTDCIFQPSLGQKPRPLCRLPTRLV